MIMVLGVLLHCGNGVSISIQSGGNQLLLDGSVRREQVITCQVA